MALKSINPTTGEIIAEIPELTDEQIIVKITAAQTAFLSWRQTSFSQRTKRLNALAGILRNQSEAIAATMAEEMGKPIKEGMAEIEKCAWTCEYYAVNAQNFLIPEKVETDASQSFISYEPLGIVLAVMPWNFPFWQVIRFAAPAVMAGNVGVLKHASNVQLSAQKIETAFRQAGFPDGVFQNLPISSNKVEMIIRDSRIKAVTLTGSEQAGAQVAKIAGEEIKKSVLELGGSDPFIILEDADLEEAVNAAVTSRNINNGQSCIAAKRFIVVASLADEFKTKFKKKFKALKTGNPLDESNNIGPIINQQGLNTLLKQIEESIANGATILTGGGQIGDRGYFLEPTILTDVKPGMPAYHQELFGPVASVIIVKDENEAIQVANDTDFGLGASLWTKDLKRAKRLVPKITAGAVFINGLVKSDPRLPFGGINKSGYGRELSSFGIKEFVNIKTVWLK
ncbi:MAG: NAD-dependent succinate-semialdehyde dehydrogenase [Patescibacteria group bacterium]|jgi:succinate-semialdehyde dehydrogenase/glutarate-semialdehyde dehydrogenase|nr:NAD-dependent succinate-semialdehyde dehydrogenase [Patescibacteria group bacterium]